MRRIDAPTSDLVPFLCTWRRHQELGLAEPDGRGHLTLHQGGWAYCAAGLATESHQWRAMRPRRIGDIRHYELPDEFADDALAV